MDPPRNRKQRRSGAAAASANAPPYTTFDPSSIPLARPPNPKESRKQHPGKTLLEIAAEREKVFEKVLASGGGKSSSSPSQGAGLLFNTDATETQFLEISSDGKVDTLDPNGTPAIIPEDDDDDEQSSLLPIIDTLFLSIPLTTLHLTLAFLAAHQYAQEIRLGELVRESLVVALPVLTFCIHLAHGHVVSFGRRKKTSNGWKPVSAGGQGGRGFWAVFFDPSLRTAVFLPLAIGLGSYLIRVTNEEPYYAVMKRAPAIGTLWVWCVLEMSAAAALVAVLGPLGWAVWIKGYRIV
jgi:hypothetical protein